MKIKSFKLLVISIFLSQLAGIIGSVGTVSSISSWYTYLVKPSFNPPNFIFGPVWTLLYTLMGIALYFVWVKGYKKQKVKTAVNLFIIHLGINTLWSLVFFGARNLGAALIIILILWAMIAYLIKLFWKIDSRSSYLLIPYLLWVSFATILNYSIWSLN
ncbi:TspO protein [Candidatus Roizmanbacteria bacterium CG11_big_fil_rev_8_21_14_0_20_36_8]|uniref:TspO protein n=2 Tax=Candidatus Roizmaniibacteriota TaxID=1752723 RepID=A0A2M6ITZ5_9BACT|nr:MAG: TspO protein [Candidatus Roizmanbacteria bacterium CG11_big_fil_rev_8_21_14_0_20_36_8]PIZ64255.1 MAG: TspO protein [Candidatus Roizmanbacteria bacterium CG_4_10_14_0_2_um_filter_36_9]